MPELIAKALAVISAAAYASALLVAKDQLIPPRGARVIIHIKEKNVKSIKWKILGSVDGVVYQEVMAEASVAQNASDYEVIADPWLYYDVQIVDDAGHGSVDIYCTGA